MPKSLMITRAEPLPHHAFRNICGHEVKLFRGSGAGGKHGWHFHDRHELALFQVCEQEVLWRVASKRTSLSNIMVIPPGKVHATRAPSREHDSRGKAPLLHGKPSCGG